MRRLLPVLLGLSILGLSLFPIRPVVAAHVLYPPYVTRYPQATLNLDVPYHRQEHALSCEIAALRMLFLHRGRDVTETELIARMPTGPMGSDPGLVFVGNIDGRQMTTGYGIDWDGLARVANQLQTAEAFYGRNLHFLIDRLHDGNPVVIWGSLYRSPRNVSWVTPEGKYVHAVSGEHTWVVTGYAGPREAPTHIFTLDPIYGRRVFRTGDFLKNWAFYHNSGMYLKNA